jgi:hypothetical protein
MARKPRETSHLRVRIDPIRIAKLERQAEKNGLTLTAEIVRRLDESFRRDDGPASLERLADQVTAKVIAALKELK